MSKKRQSILVSGAILAAGVWLFALVMLISQPGASVDPSVMPTLASLPNMESNAEQSDLDATGQTALDAVSSQSTALPIVVLNPPNQTDVNTAPPVSGGDTGLPAVNVPAEPIPNTVIIRFDAGSSEEERAAYIESIGGQVTETIGALNTVVVTVPEGVTPDTLPPAPIVTQNEPDFYVGAQASPPNDPLFSGQWGLNVVRAPEAWTLISSDSPRVLVAVVDSGICASHPDLTGRIDSGWDFVQSDDTPQDEYGHGCAVAGVIAANGNNNVGIAGVAPNVEIMPLRVLDGQGVGTYSRVAAAIVYATDNSAQIINLSLGGSNPSGVLQDAVNYAASHGVMVVAAAGNGGNPTAMYPAAYETVISVGSVDADLQRSNFSNYGPQVDLYAPGSGITSTGLNGYVTMSGTSLAAPYVSGVAALEMAVGSTLTVDGGIVAFQHTLQVEPPPGGGDVLTCNREESRQMYLAFEDLVRQQVADPTAVTDAQIKAARRAYLEATNDCFILAYNSSALTIDSEGQWIDGGDASAQFRAFGTKWGANSPFPMLQPPAITGGTVTFSFMPSGVSLALKEGVPTSTVEIAVSQLEPEVSDNFPEGTCDLQDEVRSAILLWSAVADINFQEVVDGGQPFNHSSSIVGDIRIGSHLIDGDGNELGHAFFPGPVPDEPNATGVGDLFFDAGDSWGCETVLNDAGDVIVLDIGVVTTHEIGHAIGLRHQNAPPGAVMNPTYNDAISNLAPDDIDGVRAIYGVDTLESPPLLPVTLNGNIATFNWTEVAGGSASQYQIQVSLASDPDFNVPVIDTTVPAPPFTANAPLDNNTYIWRVRGFLNGFGPFSNLTSPNATFTVAFGVPNLVAPLNGEIVSSGSVTFQWGSAGASSDTFVLQVATGTQFDSTDLVQNITNISGLSRAVSGFADGVYYWRVSKTSNDFSLPFQFSVDSNVPDLTFPPNDALLSDDDVSFTWLPVPGATEYQIQIDTSPNFAGLLFLDKLFLDKLFLDKLFLDKLFLDKLFLDKLFLDKLFLDKLFLDKLFLDKLFLDKLFLDKLFLDKLFLDKLFLDKLFLDKLFLDKLTEPTASFEKPLSEGLHYWRVRARRPDGEWGGWSQTFNFTINTRPNLVVNEIKVSDPSFIEIYNAGTSSENLTGWQLLIYEPDSATPAFTFTFPSNCMGGESGCTLAAGDYLVLHEANGFNDDENLYLGPNTMNWPLPGEAEGGSLSTSSLTATSLPVIEVPIVTAGSAVVSVSAFESEEKAGVSGRVYLDTATAQSIITVNTTDMTVEDDGQCSLIEAINTANTDTASGGQDFECETSGGADTIVLEAEGPYILSVVDNNHDDTPNGTPVVESDITIEGNGQMVTRSSEASFRIFYVTSDGTLTVNDLTVSSGFAGSFASGGAFRNAGGNLVLNNVDVLSNLAGTGGAIASSSGSLTSINNSLIENNGAVGSIGGGGIYNEGIMTITDSTLRDDETDEGEGGGLFNDGLFATMTLNRSTVSGNHAGSAGGGLRNEAGLLVLLNSTVSGNTVSLTGGAIFNSGGGTVNTSFSTINENTASEGVGGIYTDLGGAVQLRHSIIANNSTLNCFSENGEAFTTSGAILDTDASCVDGSVSPEELNLSPLQNNGGPTETHALLDGSVAIDATEECTDVENNEVTFDQRGVERPQNALCDAGAFEVGGEGGDTPQDNPYSVNTLNMDDDGMCGEIHCSLIEAVNAANTDDIDSTINLGSSQTYLLSAVNNITDGPNGLPSITTPITINGNGSAISRDGEAVQFRIIHQAASGSLTLNEVVISNGNLGLEATFLISDLGGGIYKAAGGVLTLKASEISNNTALGGGGIYSAGGTVNLTDSKVADNQAIYGAGISNNGGGTLNIIDTELGNNTSNDGTSEGGAIFTNSGLVTVSGSLFSGNQSNLGGGIFVHLGGVVNISDSEFSDNEALSHGGGLAVRGSATVNGSTFSLNIAAVNGGAIDIMDGSAIVTVTNSLIESNTSNSIGSGTGGGGIANFGTLNLIESSVVGNTSDTDGGGLFNSGTAIINRSTISGNGSVYGAGLYNNVTTNIVNSTISGNNASQFGAGVQNWGDFFAVNVTVADNDALVGSGIHYSGGSIDFKNSIMANTGDNCAVFEGFSGTITFGGSGSNLANDESCGFGFGFAPDSSLALGTLSNNGGPTQTHALLAGSVAIDGVENCTTDGETFLSVDQRGAPRPQGEACDIGAFEFGGEVPVFGTIGGAVALIPPSGGEIGLLAEGDAVPDFVRFGDTNIPAPDGTSFTGGTVDLPPDDLNIGRDPASSDSDHRTDFFSQKPSRGGQNSVTVVINEIFPGTVDAIELYNPSVETVRIGGSEVTVYDAAGSVDAVFTFPMGFELQPNRYVVLRETSGVNTEADLFMNDDISWPSTNPAGAVLLTNGVSEVDFLVFGNEAVNELTLEDVIGGLQDTGWTGPSPLPPLANEALGRDSVSTDTDAGEDWYQQIPSLGSVNPMVRPLLNDDFGDAIEILSVPYRDITNTSGAEMSNPGEPEPSCGFNVGFQVWYQYTPPVSTTLRFQTDGSKIDTVLSIWTDATTQVACDDDSSPDDTRSRIDLALTAGTTYFIGVGGKNNTPGQVVLSLLPPANDDFDEAIVVGGLPFSNSQNTIAASSPIDDPVTSCGSFDGRSVWYSFTAITDDAVRFHTEGSNFNTILSVWTGARGTLAQIACNDNTGETALSSISLQPVIGQTYYIMAGGPSDAGGQLIFNATLLIPPPNDDFVNSINVEDLESDPYDENTLGATEEVLDPEPSCGINTSKTVWFTYEAISSQTIAFQTFGSNFDTVMSIWSEDLNTELGCNDDAGAGHQSYLEFSGVPGDTYFMVISGHQGEGGDLVFEAFPLGTPPANDEPDGAFEAAPLPYAFDQPESEIINATVSVNEPTPTCGVDVGKTVWYEFTPDSDGTFSIETLGSDYDTVLVVYTDLGGTLAEVACDDDGIVDGTSRVLLNATNGTTYLILIGAWNGESGNLHLEVEVVDVSPAFDDKDTPKIIPSVPYDDSDSTLFATDGFDDPVPTCGVNVGKTVWYQYMPPTNALLLFYTNGSSFDTNLSIYLVTSDGLSEVACDDDGGKGLASFAEFAPDAGETYLIMIGGTSGSSGHLSLHVEAVEPPPNDAFEDAADLSDVFVLDLLDVRGATNAGDDPAHSCNANTGRTVWYTVTPTQNGTMSFNTLGSNYNTVMSVYELEGDNSLTEIVCDDNGGDNLTSRIDNLPSTPNQTYYVMVSGAFGQTGNLNFNVALLNPPANDEIEGAFAISGTVFDFNQETTNASNAADDPLSCGLLAGKTVWYDYVAAGDELLRIDVSGSDFNTIVAAYTGDRGSLTQIGCEFFGTLDVITEPGETYHILIGGFGGESGNLDLHAEVVTIPDNDPVDGAFEIPALPYTNTQSTEGATRIDEPPVTCDFTVGKTVWYRYSASGSEGLLHFDSVGSDFSSVIAVYKDTDSGLVQVGCNTFGAVEVPAEEGDYFIMIGGWQGKSGQLVFNASNIPQPDNDEFENATEVGQLPFTDDENTDGASNDSGDPLTCDPGSGKTVWYVFHSFGDGILHINTDGSLFNTVIAVYTNPGPPTAQVNFGPLLELDLLACEKGNQLDVPVEGGQTYYIMISGEEGDSGQLHLEIMGDITPTPPHITVEKIANPGELSEPGGEVLFTVHVKNSSIFGVVTINSIVDDVYGNVCDTLLPSILNPGESMTCDFTQFVSGPPGSIHTNNVHVQGRHESGLQVEGSDDAIVTILNLPSSIKVTKTANPVTLSEPGGLVEFTVEVENTSADDVTLTGLVDSLFGDMSAQCGLPVDLTPGQTFTCVFTGNVNGVSGDTHVNTIEASGTDDDGQPVSDIGSAVVSITCADPDPERDLRGSLPSRTRGVIINSSPDCNYVVGLASYERPDNNIDNQRLFDYSTAVIGPNQTLNLFIDVPTCALQVDLFYGEVLLSLNGVRYGERKLANRLSTNLPFCDFSQDHLNLTAALEEGTTNVHLNWDDNLLVEAAYHVERSDDGANFSEIAVLPPNSTNYLDSGLCYTHYWYRIRGAYGAGGPFTAYSSVAEVTTSCPVLAAPSELSAAAVSESQIDLTWLDNSSDESSFHVERSPDGVTWTEIASVPADSISYQDIGLTCATPYQYRVRAFRSIDAQFSPYTNISGDNTDACPPPPLPAPSELNAVAISDVQIEMGWTDNSSDETAFNIERSPDGITWSPLVSVPADTIAYQDNILTCATTYHYRVFAFRSGDSQTSDASNTAAATTFACPIILSVTEPTSNTVGLYKDGQWQFRNAADEVAPVLSFTYGEAGWLPLIGDWDGDGTDGLGVYKDGQWNLRSATGSTLSDTTFAFGPAESGWLPIVGDWNGDGMDTVGLYKGGMWLLRNNNTAGDWEINFVFGSSLSGALPVAGDWNSDGVDTVGLYLSGQWYLLDTLITTESVAPIAFGPAEGGWMPVAGDWNGDGADTIGLVKDGLWRLRNSNGDGATDLGFSFGLGASGWRPLRNFNGDLSIFLTGQPMTTPPATTDEVTATDTPEVTESATPESTETPTAEVTESETAPSDTPTETETVTTNESVTDTPTAEAPAATTEAPPPTEPSPEVSPEAG